MTTNQTATDGIPAAINISEQCHDLEHARPARQRLCQHANGWHTLRDLQRRSGLAFTRTSTTTITIQGTGTLGNIRRRCQTTITAWRTATGKDVNSFSSDPKFNSTNDLRPQPTSPLLAAGTPAGGITTDFSGVTRSVTTPSVGAYETGADVTGPAISYTTLGNTSSTASRTLSPVTIADASGVNTTTGTRPRIYFKKSTEPNALAATE